ncbi:MAG: HAMP domain-containing histidine kinase [Polyangiaceae bacterium]|nr:HAMP domain-containing histidine kinase [Polyangiaceae bacterium]
MLDHARVAVSDLQDTDLNALAGEYAKLAHYDLRSRGQTIDILLETRFAPDLPKVHAAPQELGRVILNLVHNAAYAVAAKREKVGPSFTPTVTLTTRALPGIVELRVRDNGPGIAKDIRDKVFDPFFTTKPAGEGTGLGLSISHDIVVQRHGGTIHFDSVEGQYTEFVVSLPAASPI